MRVDAIAWKNVSRIPGGRSGVTMGMPGVTNTSQPRAGVGFTCAIFDLLYDSFLIGQSLAEGALAARNGWSDQRSAELLMEKFACAPVGKRCRGGVVMRSIMPSEGVMLTRIAVDCRVRFFG